MLSQHSRVLISLLKADFNFHSDCTKMRLVLAERSADLHTGPPPDISNLAAPARCTHIYLKQVSCQVGYSYWKLANEAVLTSTL